MNASALWVVAGEGAGLKAGVPDGAGAAGLKKNDIEIHDFYSERSICRTGTVMDGLN